MASWLADHAGEVTRTFLQRAATDAESAKR